MVYDVSSFVFRIIKELQHCPYLYKSYVYSLILAMRKNYGIQCAASDDEIYEEFKKAWNSCHM